MVTLECSVRVRKLILFFPVTLLRYVHLRKDNVGIEHLIVFLPTSVAFCFSTKSPQSDGVGRFYLLLRQFRFLCMSFTVKQ